VKIGDKDNRGRHNDILGLVATFLKTMGGRFCSVVSNPSRALSGTVAGHREDIHCTMGPSTFRIDIAVVNPACPTYLEGPSGSATTAGGASKQREAQKLSMMSNNSPPGSRPGHVAFVVEATGRFGDEAKAFVDHVISSTARDRGSHEAYKAVLARKRLEDGISHVCLFYNAKWMELGRRNSTPETVTPTTAPCPSAADLPLLPPPSFDGQFFTPTAPSSNDSVSDRSPRAQSPSLVSATATSSSVRPPTFKAPDPTWDTYEACELCNHVLCCTDGSSASSGLRVADTFMTGYGFTAGIVYGGEVIPWTELLIEGYGPVVLKEHPTLSALCWVGALTEDNNSGELVAIMEWLLWWAANARNRFGDQAANILVVIATDSDNSIKWITGEFNVPFKYATLVGAIQHELKRFIGHHRFLKVESHTGVVGNERADALAELGRLGLSPTGRFALPPLEPEPAPIVGPRPLFFPFNSPLGR
jgi:ribonuclease HI